MTDQSTAPDYNDQSSDDIYDAGEWMKSLRPSFEDILRERFSAEARVAQNFAMLLAGLGIALQVGLVELAEEKGQWSAAGLKVVASARAAVGLLAATSVFFLIRFLFLVWRDSYAHRLRTVAAARAMHHHTQAIEDHDQYLARREMELTEILSNIDCANLDKTITDRETVRDKRKKIDELKRTIDGPIGKFIAISKFIDKYTFWFEISVPCFLVVALITLAAYKVLKFLHWL
ncbi:hypothetical protein ELI20_12185 [Rhizobium ruizarguesonis]|uniref:hypothetical protein n=1 Tax=Rhizobium ruizarguesonis TaxID=2081791 RepID=UPI00102FFBD3|nr:hypothetical protein [Rhizobium ruizarguesonis]TAW21897.1 hypothetical protein ELI20_12185 [Rhizobium ruizarguesonis]